MDRLTRRTLFVVVACSLFLIIGTNLVSPIGNLILGIAQGLGAAFAILGVASIPSGIVALSAPIVKNASRRDAFLNTFMVSTLVFTLLWSISAIY